MSHPPLSTPLPGPDAGIGESATRVLWTGGWDSTFRICMLVLVHRQPVQPYYLFVSQRKGSGQELATIQALKQRIREKDAAAGRLIAPTVVVERDEVPVSAKRASQFEELRKRSYLGEQYEGLANFCDWYGVHDMELCVHRDDQAHRHIAAHTISVDGPGGKRYALAPAMANDALALFENFRFPLLDVDKRQMHEIAQRHGFDDVMALTWFCHSPRNGKPCGVCNPCEYTIEEGLGWRVPASSKLRAGALRWRRRARMLLLDPQRLMKKAFDRLRQQPVAWPRSGR